jgi:hypothetical protein
MGGRRAELAGCRRLQYRVPNDHDGRALTLVACCSHGARRQAVLPAHARACGLPKGETQCEGEDVLSALWVLEKGAGQPSIRFGKWFEMRLFGRSLRGSPES